MASNEIPVIGPLLSKMFGSRNERFVRKYTSRVDEISAMEPEVRSLSDAAIRERIAALREGHDGGARTEDLLVPVFALAREAMDRSVGIRNIFDPELGFDPSMLSEEGRRLYAETRAEMDALGPREPEGEFLGEPGPVAAWRYVAIPVGLYEAVREALPESRPPFRARPFDVQLIGGMVLSQGRIAEMKTGEGKTIVAPLAAALAVVERMQVHIVTVNDYLVQRDRDWTAPFFRALGFTSGAIHPQHTQPEDVKRRMYRCDVVYGTTSEFGFDYLRDNMKRSVEQQVQRKRQFAIVDEVDSVLIDEARTPLIISGAAQEGRPRYELADGLAKELVRKQAPWQSAEDGVQRCKETIKGLEGDIRTAGDRGRVPELQQRLAEERARLPELERERDRHTQYYEIKKERKQAYLTHDGVAEAQKLAGVGSFYVGENQDIPHLLEQAIRAYAVYERDKDYIVANVPDRMTGRTEPSVVIVDQNTGRAMYGRQWSDGLHQAVEAKEGVRIKEETQTVATVTIQNFFKMYRRLAGMTGTADTEAQEFHDIYGLDVVSIPTNRPMIRQDRDDLIFLRQKDKWEQVVDEIKQFHDAGRPVLVGTTSVEKSEMLSQLLTRRHQVKHSVLNAKQHEQEAEIVAGAGQLGAVMIATNMAGRGTDIKLGRCPREALLDHWLRRGVVSRGLSVESGDGELRENAFRKIAQAELKGEGLKKRDAEQMPFEELELALLRHWATHFTWMSPRQIESASAEALIDELDATGRVLLHRIRWFESIEDMGGLHVLGTERHESRRIDNQLRGRSGRQGDRGSSRFYVSFEDDLMRLFAGEKTQALLARFGMKEGEAIEHPWLSKNVERAQRKVEERNFQVRKNILEYDEVMEHQRQHFYGLRQRVLEGRDLRGLIFEYIEDAIDGAIEEMLDVEYPAQCAADFAKDRLECSIPHERLRGKSLGEMEEAIRRLAREDAEHTIDVTLGEYMPIEGSEVSVDFDSAGLIKWARETYGVELDAGELREGGPRERREVRDRLERAAFEKIQRTELAGLEEFVAEHYGARKLAEWVKSKFGFDVDPEDLARAHADEDRSARDPILDKARELYENREIDYPVQYVMEMTMVLAQRDPGSAFGELAGWTRRRLGIELTEEEIRRTPPQRISERLREEQRAFVAGDRLASAIEEAVAIEDDDRLDEHLRERYGVGITDRMRHLEGEERAEAIAARVENILRTELIQFERSILLEVLDTSWKDHLYAMDQLRDSIGFRAFSQQDPRIQYKREGAQIFNEMLDGVRDKVTDYIFKARFSPAAALQQQQAQQQTQRRTEQQALQSQQARRAAQQQARQQGATPGAGNPAGGMLAGPGFGTISGPGLSGGFAPPAGAVPGGRAPAASSGAEEAPGVGNGAGNGPREATGAMSDGDAAEASGDSAGEVAARGDSPEEQMQRAQAAKAADRGKERQR